MKRSKIALSALLIALLTPAFGESDKTHPPTPSTALQLAQQLNNAFVEIADQVSPSVVVINIIEKRPTRQSTDSIPEVVPPEWHKHQDDKHSHSSPRKHSSGSGVVLTEDGYIITNDHVVENAEKIRVRFLNGQEFDATVKGVDTESDIAVIRIKARGLKPARLGDSEKTHVGDYAIAIGAPYDLNYSVTVGHISAKGRSFPEPGAYTDQDFIQTDASINPGNSGGPLVNIKGEVIGINARIRPNSGIGFTIPINLAKRVAEHLIHEGRFQRSFMGVTMVELKEYSAFRDLPPELMPDTTLGVVVDEIEKDSPAAKSQLKPGDVVTAVDGVSTGTSRSFKDEIASKKPGQTVVLKTVRAKQHLDVKVTMGALLPDAQPGNEESEKLQSETTPEFGLTVETLDKKLAQERNVESIPGILITAVDPGSGAYDQGVKVGDIITEINRKPVTTSRQFQDALKKADKKRAVMLNIVNDGSSRLVLLKAGD